MNIYKLDYESMMGCIESELSHHIGPNLRGISDAEPCSGKHKYRCKLFLSDDADKQTALKIASKTFRKIEFYCS